MTVEDPTDATQRLDDATPASAPGPQLAVGARVHRYIVLDAVGEGGMGTVYAAYDPGLDRKVALKVLQPDRLGGEARALLLGEAKTLAKLRHAHVLAVHDLGALPDGRLFMATDLIEGANARDWARAARRSWRDVRDVFVDAGRGLAAVHASGLVHRDLKPSNLLVDDRGRACVADFGIAVTTGATTHVAGTRAYMSPEQLRGESASPASDQYAFGVALQELLAAGGPAPKFLRAAIARMTAEDPAARFADMDAVVRAISADPARRARVVLGVAVVAVAVAVVAIIALTNRPAAAPAPCPDAPELLAGTWDPARRAEVEAALATAVTPDAAHAAIAELDTYERGWRTARRDACLATRVRRDQAEDVLALRMECLDRRRRSMHAMVDALAHAGDRGATDPALAVAGLPSVEVCADVTLLRSRAPLPANTEQQAKLAALEGELDALDAVVDLLQISTVDAHARADALAARARALDAPHLVAQALILRGYREGGAAAIDTLLAAIIAGQQARDYEAMVGAGVNAVMFLCNASRYPEADFVARLLGASYDAGGRPPSLERDMLWIEANLGLCQLRADDAIRAFARLYDIYLASARPVDRASAASAATNVSFAAQYLEHPEDAVMWSRRAEDLAVGNAMDGNALLTHYGTAWAAIQLGDPEMAAQAIARIDGELPTIAAQVGELVCLLPLTRGMAALAQDLRADARAQLADADRCLQDHGAGASAFGAMTARSAAELALADGDPTRALALARAMATSIADTRDARNAISVALAARALVHLGRLDDAAAELARAEPFLAHDDHHDERWAMVAFARAELALARGDTATARAQATEARELRANRHDAFHLAQLDALLARMQAATHAP